MLDEDKWLRFSPAGVWIASNTLSKDKNESDGVRTYARSKGSGALPCEPTEWVDRNLCPLPLLRVQCFGEAEWALQCERLEKDAKAAEVVVVRRSVYSPVRGMRACPVHNEMAH